MCMNVCIMHIHVYMFVGRHAWGYMCAFKSINTHIYLHTYVVMDKFMYTCVCIYAIWMDTFWHVYWQTYMSLYVMHMSVCIYPYMYAGTLCMYTCHKGVMFQIICPTVHLQGTSHQFASNGEKTNN